jgi:hypothetical protein
MSQPGKGTKENQTLRDYQGVNTRSARTVIGDNQFAWLENAMPIGFGNMVVVPKQSSTLATWPTTVYRMRSVNLNGIDYEIGFGTNGAGYAVNLSSFVVTTFAAAGTFQGSGTSVAQWENAQAVIVDPTLGYFTWDGTTLSKWNGTLQSLTITAIGKDYTTAPTIGFASGSAAATCHIQVGLAGITAAGTGYTVGDILTLVGGTFTTAGQIKVASVNTTTGAVTGIALDLTGDYTVAPTNPVSVTGGYGTGATFTLNFGIGPITLTNIGSGYTSAPIVSVTGGGGSAGAVTANITAVPSGGTSVATSNGRVWVASNRTVVFSAPDSFNDFSSTAAGGSFIAVDETLHSTITGLFSANNFLYIFGTSSIDTLSDVNVVSSTINGFSSSNTVFSKTNISASVGTSDPLSITSYYRGVWFSAPYGFHALYGTSTTKVSDDIDGTFNLADTSQAISSGQALINGIMCQCFLFRYVDPDVGVRSLLAVFFDKKWFFCSQGDDLTQVDTAIIAGKPTLFGTNGTTLTRLFSDSTVAVSHVIKTKLWDMGDSLRDKETFKVGLEMISPLNPLTVTGTVDTEFDGDSYAFTLNGGEVVQWVNNSGQTVQWVNNSGQIVQWVQSGYTFQATGSSTSGKYLGITVTSDTQGRTYQGFHLQFAEKGSDW